MRLKKILIIIFVLLAVFNGVHAAPDSLAIDPTSVYVKRQLETSENKLLKDLVIQSPTIGSDPIIVPNLPLADSTAFYRSKAQEYQDQVTARDAYVGNLNSLTFLQLPVGLTSTVAGLEYTVIISKLEVTPKGSFIEAYLQLEVPQTGDKIAFRGTKIPFSNNGGLTGTGRLELIGDYAIAMTGNTLLSILGKGNTFVEFDCNGFKGMSIEAGVEFSRDLIIPEDNKGQLKPAPARVMTSFVVYGQSWSDLLVGINIEPFQVNGLRGVTFAVSKAYMDWSDLANPPGLMFPPGYKSAAVTAGTPLLWQGFYLQRVEVRFPQSFTGKKKPRLTLGVENMILDDVGMSGTVFAENVLTAGDMSGWAYTIDRVSLDLVMNKVKGFEFAGKVSIPKIKAKDKSQATNFGYLAQRGADGNYLFAVKLLNEMRLPLLVADLSLYQGSTVYVQERDTAFYPTVILNGELSIKVAGQKVNPNLSNIRFEGLRISSEKPYFDIQAVGFGEHEQSVSDYPVVINNIMIRKPSDNRIGIGFDLTVNIGGKAAEGGFGGTAALTVWGSRDSTVVAKTSEEQTAVAGKDDWRFESVDLSGVGIKVKKPGVFDIAGMVRFFDKDPVYGDGFAGTIHGSLGKLGVAMDIEALFGKTQTYRYWYADALVTFKNGIEIFPGFAAYGFGGGYFSNMKQSIEPLNTPLGKPHSGIYYKPAENTIGIKAMVVLGTVRPEAFKGDVTLEMIINKSGGISSVALIGNAQFMGGPMADLEKTLKDNAPAAVSGKAMDKLIELVKGQVYGSMKMQYDVDNDVFHGNLEIYVNVAAGLVRGVSTGNKAGWATLHFAPDEWYILIGTPDQPLGIEVARIFKSKSYFMLGQHLPGSPPPPSQVSEILGINAADLDYMRDFNALNSGTGFAFGMNFIVDTGDLRFLMFYARFAAGAGFDFMLKDYGDGYHCEGSSGPFGINGWYANGQAYAFVQGKIGIKVNLRFYKGSYDILNIGVAALLQTKGPNPFWMKGIVGGHYRILGGLVKGDCKFEVTIGQDCKPVGEQNVLADVNIISEMSPSDGATDVDVFTTPQVAFNIPVGQVFSITDVEDKNHSFRASLDEFVVLDGQTPILGDLKWNETNDVVVFDGRDLLPGQKKLTARTRLTFEENVNGSWQKVKFDGAVVEETAAITFQTAKAPDYIPANNVSLSYPLKAQVNFYPKEYSQGFIQLIDGQPYLFDPNAQWTQKVRITSATDGGYVESDLVYNANEKQVQFTLPDGMTNATVYRFEIVNIPRANAALDANVKQVETALPADGGDATLTTKHIEGTAQNLEVKTVYYSPFRTSKYNTFIAKLKAMDLGPTSRVDLAVNVFQLAAYLKGDELWEESEWNGAGDRSAMIRLEATLPGTDWYDDYAYPLVYKEYPLNGSMTLRTRNVSQFGMPPTRDMYFANVANYLTLPDGATDFKPAPFSYEYVAFNVGRSTAIDWEDLRNQAANFIADHPKAVPSQAIENLITKPMPYIRYGKYRFTLSYIIPGVNKVSSSYTWQMFNRIPDNDK